MFDWLAIPEVRDISRITYLIKLFHYTLLNVKTAGVSAGTNCPTCSIPMSGYLFEVGKFIVWRLMMAVYLRSSAKFMLVASWSRRTPNKTIYKSLSHECKTRSSHNHMLVLRTNKKQQLGVLAFYIFRTQFKYTNASILKIFNASPYPQSISSIEDSSTKNSL